MSIKTASIIGARPVGLSLAVDLATNVFSVLVYFHQDHPTHANQVIEQGYLEARGEIVGRLNFRVTSYMGEAIGFSELLFLTVPSIGQKDHCGPVEGGTCVNIQDIPNLSKG